MLIDGKDVKHVPPYQRDVNTVFQSYALFPHLNVFDNIAFGLKMKKRPKAEIRQKVEEMLHLVRMSEFSKRMLNQLSGGQKQRVAIARALANQPKVLLLDEPLGALDVKLRKQMQVELKVLQQKLGITFIYVTHDQEEALIMSDRIAVMNQGIIEQVGTPQEIYNRPQSRFVAGFVGEVNIMEGKIVSLTEKFAYAEWQKHTLAVPNPQAFQIEENIHLAIRPENISLITRSQDRHRGIPGEFQERIYAGSHYKTIVAINEGYQMIVHERPDQLSSGKAGERVYVSWEPDKMMVMKK